MIMLNGNEEEVVELKERMEVRKANKVVYIINSIYLFMN